MTDVLWNADYSQLELRIFAFVLKCRAMTETFMDPKGDIHATTVERIYGIPKAKQTAVHRIKGKTLNFGMAYGASGETVEEQITTFALRMPELEIEIPSLSECNDLVKEFWKAYPDAKQGVEYMHSWMQDHRYAEDLYGRRLQLPFANSSNGSLRARALRQGFNMMVQGPAGTMIKMAALGIRQEQDEYQADTRAQIHDELMGRVGGTQENKLKWLGVVERCMVLDQPLMPVPLMVVPKLVQNWKEAK